MPVLGNSEKRNWRSLRQSPQFYTLLEVKHVPYKVLSFKICEMDRVE